MSRGDIYKFKIVIIGESGVGKSSLLKRLCDGDFTEGISTTRGHQDRLKEIEILNRKVSLHIWDTAGQEKYRGINRMYYRGASGGILVFDLTSLDTFSKLDSWLKEFREEIPDGEIILVGNKIDRVEFRQVSKELAENYAKTHKMIYLETSAKTDHLVNEAFMNLSENILNNFLRRSTESVDTGHRLTKTVKTKSKSGCCK